MKHAEYKYLEDTLSGRRQRDPEFESTMSEAIDPRVAERQRLIDSKTPEQREIEQRRYSLDTYGPEHMKRYARPIVTDKPLGKLAIEGDQIISAPQARGHNAPPQQLKVHSEKPEPWQNSDGSLRLQNHSACPIKQVLKVY
jgi:hypothetical protein